MVINKDDLEIKIKECLEDYESENRKEPTVVLINPHDNRFSYVMNLLTPCQDVSDFDDPNIGYRLDVGLHSLVAYNIHKISSKKLKELKRRIEAMSNGGKEVQLLILCRKSKFFGKLKDIALYNISDNMLYN